MANDISDRVWRIDTTGAITTTPVNVKAITYVFSAAGGVGLFQETTSGPTVFRCAPGASSTEFTVHHSFGSKGVRVPSLFAKTLTNVTEILIYV